MSPAVTVSESDCSVGFLLGSKDTVSLFPTTSALNQSAVIVWKSPFSRSGKKYLSPDAACSIHGLE